MISLHSSKQKGKEFPFTFFNDKTEWQVYLTEYPELTERDFMTVIQLQNDSNGTGDYIKAWNHPTLAKPTDAQLAEIN